MVHNSNTSPDMASPMEIFLNFIPSNIKTGLIKWYEKQPERTTSTFSIKDWLLFWDEELIKEFKDSIILSDARKREIIERLPQDIFNTIIQKKRALKERDDKWKLMNKREIERLKGQEAWYSVNPTTSKSHYRFQIGFRNNGCKYWRDNPYHIGCFNCGYFFETFDNHIPIEDNDLINQFSEAYETVKKEVESGIEPDFDVIEFLSDGSYLNDDEVPEKVRIELFRKINEHSKINRILIETRPEYITQDKVSILLDQLTQQQKVEIAIGLESMDKFILTFCINKGYYIEDIQEKLKEITEINNKYQNRCSILFYVLVKSAYLNEREALEDAFATVTELYNFMSRYKIDFLVKLEPTVVPKGTILDVLYHDTKNGSPYYFPPSYWTILEILARLEYEGIGNLVRIGAREDMDRYFEIPVIYYKTGERKGMLSRYDFLIYEAVQNYNIHHNFRKVLIPLVNKALKDSSFDDWAKEIGIKYPFFMRYYDEHKTEIENEREIHKDYFDSKENLTNKLVKILNMIEYGHDFQQLAEKYQKSGAEDRRILNEITEKIKGLIEKESGIPHKKIKINDQDIALMQLREDWILLRMHIKILAEYNGDNDDRSIWIGIPTKGIHLTGDSLEGS